MNESSLREGLTRIVSEELLYQRGRPPQARYVFKHALIQEAAYESILKRTRKRYHAEAAAWLEKHAEDTGQSRPEIIAHHYARAGNDEAAVTHWQRAGEQAIARCANREALHHLHSALEHVERLPESPDRDRSELDARVTCGLVLLVLRGIGDVEVRQNYMLARTLCTRVGNATQHFSVLHGLSLALLATEDSENQAMAVSRELLELATATDDEGQLLEAHRAVGTAALNEARLDMALEHFEAGIALYEPARDRSLANAYGACPGLLCHAFSAWILCLQDNDQQCCLRIEEALSMAPALEHPYSEALVLTFAAMIEQLRDNPAAAKERADTALEFAQQHGFSLFKAWAGVLEAWADITLGTEVRGDALARLRDGMQAWQASGGQSMMHYRICLYADACLREDAVSEGLAALDQLASAPQSPRRNYYEPEIDRLRGELLLHAHNENPDQDPDAPRACFERSLIVARDLGTAMLERRATKSLERIETVHP